MFQITRTKSHPKQRPSKARSRFFLSAGCMLAGLTSVAMPTGTLTAQTTFVWNNLQEYWDEPGAWTPGGPPGANDIASFQNVAIDTVFWDNFTANRQVGKLQITAGNYQFNNTGSSQYELTINSDADDAFQVTGASTVFRLAGLHFNAASGGGNIGAGSRMHLVGNHPRGAKLSLRRLHVDGELNVESGAQVSLSSQLSGGRLSIGSGTVKVTGEGSSLSVSGNALGEGGGLSIGSPSGGTLLVEAGGQVVSRHSSVGVPYGVYDNDSGSATITGTGSKWTNESLIVGSSASGTLDVTAGGEVVSQSGTLGYLGNGTATIDGVGSKWTVANDLRLGINGFGVLHVQNGGEVSSASALVASVFGLGAVTVTGAGSKWTNTGNLEINNGSLNVEAGGEASTANALVNAITGSSSSVNVDGPGSKLNLQGLMILGGDGTTSLNVRSGGEVSTLIGSSIGFGTGPSLATVKGGGSKWNTAELAIVSGRLKVEEGGEVYSTDATIATNNGNEATVTVTGAGSKWTTSGELVVASEGIANMFVVNGAQVSSMTGVIGAEVGSNHPGTGTVRVSGAGSSWTNSNSLTIGNLGIGTLSIENGGEISNTSGLIGQQSGGMGTVTVTGFNSKWTNSNALLVGGEGTGTLNVENRGQVSSDLGFIAAQAGSSGTVTVTGIDSKWTNADDLFVGFEGTGTLNVNNRGLVSVGGDTSINATSQVNLNGGRLEFGTTDQTSFKRINAVSGSLAGTLNVSGLHAASSFTALTSAADSSEVIVVNSGRLFGDGLLGASVVNLSNGEIRVSSNQFMAFEGAGNINAGEINNTGGRIEFNQGLQNDAGGFISGRGEFAANDGGWVNNGVLAFSGGLADVYGDVANGSSGTIAIAGNSTTTFYDDVTMSAGNMNVRISQNGSAVFFGSYNGGSVGTGTVHTFGDLRPGNSPGAVSFGGDLIMGDGTFTQIELGGLDSGMFDQLFVAGDLFLDGTLDVQLIDGFTLGYNQTFDIATVDGAMLGQFSNFDDGDLIGNFGGVDLFISYHRGGSSGHGVSFFSAVPEPSSALLLAIGIGAISLRRRRRE